MWNYSIWSHPCARKTMLSGSWGGLNFSNWTISNQQFSNRKWLRPKKSCKKNNSNKCLHLFNLVPKYLGANCKVFCFSMKFTTNRQAQHCLNISVSRIVLVSKWFFEKTAIRENGFSRKRLFEKMAFRENGHSRKRPFEKTAIRENGVRENGFRENVFRENGGWPIFD